MRLGHIGRLLTKGALAALANWFMAVEKVGRWPAAVRSVIEVALAKKAGGARLIGLAASIYRLWARLRYQDVKAVLEQRLARPELAAAPGRGATSTAFELSMAAEVAAARDGVAATSIADISKFFEYVNISEFAGPAMRLGIPKCIIAPAAHFYLGPRRLRVGGAYSAALHPRRSIVAGCTWCTVFVRVAVLAPLDGLRKQLKAWTKDWEVNIMMRMFIDDCMVSTTGALSNVTLVHAWVSEYTISWVKEVLKKQVAVPKLQCIAANGDLRKALRARLANSGYRVTKIGDVLGTDFAGGGRLTRRRLQEQRRRRARARKGRLKWWHKIGRNAAKVVDSGIYRMKHSACSATASRPLYCVMSVARAVLSQRSSAAGLRSPRNLRRLDPSTATRTPPPSTPPRLSSPSSTPCGTSPACGLSSSMPGAARFGTSLKIAVAGKTYAAPSALLCAT